MSASKKTLAQDTVNHEGAWEPVYCQGCGWRGNLGELLISEYEDNETLYCPQCKWLGWAFR